MNVHITINICVLSSTNLHILINYQVPQFKFYEEIKKFEKIDSNDDRRKKAREIYDTFIMRELLSNSGEEK